MNIGTRKSVRPRNPKVDENFEYQEFDGNDEILKNKDQDCEYDHTEEHRKRQKVSETLLYVDL